MVCKIYNFREFPTQIAGVGVIKNSLRKNKVHFRSRELAKTNRRNGQIFVSPRSNFLSVRALPNRTP